jgi:hypothetical protein
MTLMKLATWSRGHRSFNRNILRTAVATTIGMEWWCGSVAVIVFEKKCIFNANNFAVEFAAIRHTFSSSAVYHIPAFADAVDVRLDIRIGLVRLYSIA